MSSVKQKLARLERVAHADDDSVEVRVTWSDEEARALEERCRREGVTLVTLTIGGVDLENDI